MESDSHPAPKKFNRDHDTMPYLRPRASTDNMRLAFSLPVATGARSTDTLPLSHDSRSGNNPATSILKSTLTPLRYYRWNHTSELIYFARTWTRAYFVGSL